MELFRPEPCQNRDRSLCTYCHLLIQSRQQDLYSSSVVVHSLLACVNLPQVHILAVTNIWTQLHGTQKNLKWNVKEDKLDAFK